MICTTRRIERASQFKKDYKRESKGRHRRDLDVGSRHGSRKPTGQRTVKLSLRETLSRAGGGRKSVAAQKTALPEGEFVAVETSTRLNEIGADAVGGLVEAIQADPVKARKSFAAQVTWKGALASEARVREFAPIASDEPAAFGGADSAPNPVEQLLAALGNCLAVGYAANATAAGIQLNDLRVEVNGDVDLRVFLGLAEGHAGFDSITATVTIDADASPERVAWLHAKVLASSPVGDTVRNAVPLEVVLA
jgi:uncharacterized OsmC-like protein